MVEGGRSAAEAARSLGISEQLLYTWRSQCQKYEKGLIVHSDQGSQYNSNEFKERLRKNGFRQSMSRKDEVLDNSIQIDQSVAFQT